jgi:hypothetical protein
VSAEWADAAIATAGLLIREQNAARRELRIDPDQWNDRLASI